MVDTTSFETSVVVTKVNENGDPTIISMIDNNNNIVSTQKIRAKRRRIQHETEREQD